jgi:biopolymer transport protein ExbD
VNLNPRRTEDPEINLISLIDVMLMLVVFFMLSSTFTDEGRMKVQLPTATEQVQTAKADRIIVTVTQEGGYRVNERDLINASRETLRGAIAEIAGETRSARVLLRADARATHQSVVTAMDVLGRMGFAQLDIATVQPAPTQ